MIEHFDEAWRALPDYHADVPDHPFRPFGITPGHGLEWARLLVALHGSLASPPAWLIDAAERLFARAVEDGWVAPGDFVYTTDLSGAPGAAAYRFHLTDTSLVQLTPERATDALPPKLGALHVGSLALALDPTFVAIHALVEAVKARATYFRPPGSTVGCRRAHLSTMPKPS